MEKGCTQTSAVAGICLAVLFSRGITFSVCLFPVVCDFWTWNFYSISEMGLLKFLSIQALIWFCPVISYRMPSRNPKESALECVDSNSQNFLNTMSAEETLARCVQVAVCRAQPHAGDLPPFSLQRVNWRWVCCQYQALNLRTLLQPGVWSTVLLIHLDNFYI